MTLYHSSQDPAFRTPPGALAAGEQVTLRIRAEGATAVTLRFWWDGAPILVPMAQSEDGLFEAQWRAPDRPGLLWYYFICEAGGERAFYGNAPDCLGGEGAVWSYEPPSFQITVYDPAFAPPAWMRETVIYQIMVDRFYASRPVSERTPPEFGHWHEDWYEPPELTIQNGDNAADDFFGGDLEGVRQKLPYLKALGVGAIYFNPIFRARSNHKYDTADYQAIDPAFGDEADFRALCGDAQALGIRVVLDGVFSHTGAYSKYFNLGGSFPSVGAYQARKSPYASWYTFKKWPDDYDCWWGFKTLPNVREMDEGYLDFILRGPDAVAAHWLRAGAGGWRLDVADELPMPFLRELRRRAKKTAPDAAIIGEVWEDPTNKIAYGEVRCYCEGDTLDSAMNYPLREAAFDFLMGKSDAFKLVRRIEAMRESMPKPFFYAMMNLLGSHDKPRAINVLADCGNMQPERRYRFPLELTAEQYARGRRRLIEAWRLVCALPGMPSLYYGDEAGLTGMADPFCRRAYPWGREDAELVEQFRGIARERRASRALRTGGMRLIPEGPDVLTIERFIEGGVDAFGQSARDETAVVRIDRRGL